MLQLRRVAPRDAASLAPLTRAGCSQTDTECVKVDHHLSMTMMTAPNVNWGPMEHGKKIIL